MIIRIMSMYCVNFKSLHLLRRSKMEKEKLYSLLIEITKTQLSNSLKVLKKKHTKTRQLHKNDTKYACKHLH